MTTFRTRSAAACAGLAVVAAVAVSTGSASADPGDPITAGSTTFTVPAATVLSGVTAGIVAIPTSPANVSYDQTANTAVYTLPVSGGDGSVNAFYGSVNDAGGLLIADTKTKKSLTLTKLSFSLSDLTVSATPAGSSTSLVLADINGAHTFGSDKTTGNQSFTGSDAQLDAAAATYLNKALGTTVFKAGQHLGSFATTFTNTQY